MSGGELDNPSRAAPSRPDAERAATIHRQLREQTDAAIAHQSLRLLAEQLPAIVWTIDADMRITSGYGAGLRAVGHKPNQFVGVSLRQLLMELDPSEDSEMAYDMHCRALAGESVAYEMLWLGRNLRAHLEPLRDMDGLIIGVIGVSHDATDLVSANQRMIKQNAALSKIANSDAVTSGRLGEAFRLITETGAEALGVERVNIWLYDRDRTLLECVDGYQCATRGHESGTNLQVNAYPSYFHALEKDRVIAAHDARHDERTREFTDTYLDRYGIGSLLDTPIRRAGGIIGAMCFEHVGPPREWTTDEQTFAGSMSDLVSLALEANERAKTDQALRESEQRFRLLAENIPGVIYLCKNDARYTMLYLNDAVEELTGYSKEDFLEDRISFVDLYHPDDAPNIIPQVDQALSKPRPFKLQYRIKHRDGRWRWIEEHGLGVYRDNELLFLEGYLSDITDRKEAESERQQTHERLERAVAERTSELRDSEARLRGITNAVPGVVYQYRRAPDGRQWFEFLSEGARDIYGCDADEIVRDFELAWNMTLEEDVPDLLASIETSARTLRPWFHEFRIRALDGKIKWLRGNSIPEPAHRDDGTIVWNGILTDITGSKRDELRLLRVQAAVDQVNDAVIITDAELDPPGPRIVYVNVAFEQMTGYTAHEVIDKTPRILQGPRTSRQTTRQMRQHLNAGEPWSGETVNYRKDHSPYNAELQLAPIRDATGQIIHWVSIQRDITERKLAEERERRHQAELAHVARLSTMGEMASGMAHELNQPLAAISNYARGTVRRLSDGQLSIDDIDETLQRIVVQAERAGTVIRRMRDFVRKRDLRRSTAYLGELVGEVCDLIDSEARRYEVSIEVDIDRDLPPVLVDAIQIEQVILNLVRNAIEAMLDNTPAQRVVRIGARLDGEAAVQLDVTDRGAAPTEDVIDRMFDAFYTTKPAGMGMGLAISRSITEVHGGRLWATRNDNAPGMTFHLTLLIPSQRDSARA